MLPFATPYIIIYCLTITNNSHTVHTLTYVVIFVHAVVEQLEKKSKK